MNSEHLINMFCALYAEDTVLDVVFMDTYPYFILWSNLF